jgi:hypothetical protein
MIYLSVVYVCYVTLCHRKLIFKIGHIVPLFSYVLLLLLLLLLVK